MILNKFLVEIKFLPNLLIIDRRGQIASSLISEQFPQWAIDKDRVTVSGELGTIFFSYNAFGFLSETLENSQICLNVLDNALRMFNDFQPLRWGVRLQSLESSKKKFSTLTSSLQEKLLNFKSNDFSKINGTLVDIGVSYIFKKEHDAYHLTTGPMEKEQSSQIFDKVTFSNGLYLDLDIYRNKDNFYRGDFKRARVEDFIKNKLKEAQEITDSLLGTIDAKE
jgi:hypothetical protein